MYKQLVPYTAAQFAGKKMKPVTDFSFAAESYIAPIYVSEMRQALHSYPMVFLKEPSGKYGLYALMGLKPNQNVFIDEKGVWADQTHIPLALRKYPFSLAKKSPEEENLILCLDQESGLLNDKEGEDLVGEDGKPSKMIQEATKFLTDVFKAEQATAAFCQELASLGLLESLDMKIRDVDGGDMENITGCQAVNEEKLTSLPDADYLRLKKKGAIALIYAHQFSLQKTERLVRFRAIKSEKA